MLKAETFRCLEESQSLDEFLRANTGGSSPLLFPTLLGLRLAEDFDLGTRFETRQNVERGGSAGRILSVTISYFPVYHTRTFASVLVLKCRFRLSVRFFCTLMHAITHDRLLT